MRQTEGASNAVAGFRLMPVGPLPKENAVIAQFLNRQVVLDQLEAIREQASEDRQRIRAQGGAVDEHDLVDTELAAAGAREGGAEQPVELRAARGRPARRLRAAAARRLRVHQLRSDDQPSPVGARTRLYDRPAEAAEVAAAPPPDDRRGVGDEPMVTNKSLKNVPVRNPTSDRRVFDRFSITDAQWVRSKSRKASGCSGAGANSTRSRQAGGARRQRPADSGWRLGQRPAARPEGRRADAPED